MLLLSHQRFAQLALQHTGIEHRHFAIHDGKGKLVAIGAVADACERADAVRMRKGACLSLYLATSFWSCHFALQSAIGA